MDKKVGNYDVAVVGGGPAGMMAAIKAAESGAKVILLEKNPRLGKKLIATGNGRCNLTQVNRSDSDFVKEIGKQGRFLFPSLSAFGPRDVVAFFRSRGLKTKIDGRGRVFPVSDRSLDVYSVLATSLKKAGVTVESGKEISGLEFRAGKISGIRRGKKLIEAKSYVLATGGKSYPATGSTGDGYRWAESLGHGIETLRPALAPVLTDEKWTKSLQGVSLKDVEVRVVQDGKKQGAYFGEMIFTHFGLSGPIILDASRIVGKLLEKGLVTMEIDLMPKEGIADLEKRLLGDFEKKPNTDFKNYLFDFLPRRMVAVFARMSGIDPDRKLRSITREERVGIARQLKGMKSAVSGLMGYDQAMVTGGGVSLKEIDSKTMRSKLVPNLYFCGEMIDLDGPTGGYNLQICWSTGYVAGVSASEQVRPNL